MAYTEGRPRKSTKTSWLRILYAFRDFFLSVGLLAMQQSALSIKQGLAPALVAPGDECGQFISNLVLALFACHIQKFAMSRSYIEQAYANVIHLSSQGYTIRAPGLTKMVHLVSEAAGLSETLFLPILDDVLLLPSVDTKEVARVLRTSFPRCPIFTFADASITYHRVRLRTGRVRQSVAIMAEMESSASIGALIQDTLGQCLYPAVPSANALDQADDYLTLALNFARSDNYPLAAISLAKAKSALRDFESQPNSNMHSGRMDRAWAGLANLEHALAAMAS